MHLSTTPAASLQEGRTSPIEPDSEGSQAQPHALNGLLLLSEAADTPMQHSVCGRRVRFLARFIYWTYKHGTSKHAAWVCNYEGLWW